MSKKYYAWKNRECQGINPEWIELTGKEFVELCKANKDLPDEEKRWFYKLPGLEEGDDYLIMECTYENFMKSEQERLQRHRKTELWECFECLSLDYTYSNESGEILTLADVVGDSNVSVETDYLNVVLYDAIEQLETTDKEFIFYWIKSKKMGMPDENIAQSLGITRNILRYAIETICNKLKRFF